jgi:hypothetical protein
MGTLKEERFRTAHTKFDGRTLRCLSIVNNYKILTFTRQLSKNKNE